MLFSSVSNDTKADWSQEDMKHNYIKPIKLYCDGYSDPVEKDNERNAEREEICK